MTDSQLSSADSPERPSGSIDVKAPPDAVVAQDTSSVLATVLPLTGSMGVMVFMAVSNSNGNRTLFLGGGMVVAMLSMVGINIYRQVRQHRESVKDQRREYLAYLSELRNSVRTMAGRQRRHAVHVLPEPEALPYFVKDGRRVWERGAGDDEMLVRLGRSTQPLSVDLIPEKLDALAKPDPVCLSAMSRFVATHRDVDGLPLGTSLRYYSRVEVVGEAEATRALTRALLVHLMSMTPPSRLRVAVVASGETLEQWEWLKWAPHAWSDSVEDDAGPARMIGLSWEEVAGLLPEGLENRGAFSSNATDAPVPSIVVVVDGGWVPPGSPIASSGGLNGVTVIDLPERWGPLTSLSTLRVLLHPASTLTHATPMEVVRAGEDPALAVADTMDIATAEAVVRHLSARFSVSGETAVSSAPVGTPDPKRSADLLNLLELGDVRDFNPDSDWRRRSGRDRLRVPFAVTPEGAPVVLDIKESAESGMGPHGLLVGATGSGKSEVLRTLVLALALTHPPDQLNFVLVDFKGGATFAGMSELPHVSAMISNLESELGLVDRMEEALRGEMTRRQEILRDAGNYANVTDYEEARRAGKHNGEPLPALFVILDEFSELLSAKPDFIEVFVAIGRLGRSMQIHLLLSSQRLEEGRLHGLESHLSYRIGLRTFSSAESRIVLGVADAYDLPPYPGSGYLKSGTRDMTRYLLKYDSVHGEFKQDVKVISDDFIEVNGKKIRVFSTRDLNELGYADYGADVVLECTGKFLTTEKCEPYLARGVKKVVMSAPAKDDTATFVVGVNDDKYASEAIVSNASCTTNGLAPVAKVLNDKFGIVKGLMTTIHAYTNGQSLVDVKAKDFRRSRAAALNIGPTTTGAAKAIAKVLPELNGKMHGQSVRVPVANVSMVDLTAVLKRPASKDEINDAFRTAAESNLKGILFVDDDYRVSSDFCTSAYSSIVASDTTQVIAGDMVKVFAWYDNEWGYSTRLVDLAKIVATK